MGKRSEFERRARDYYSTPPNATKRLLPHLGEGVRFCEPCAGDGRLTDVLVEAGHKCVLETDIEPDHKRIYKKDALELDEYDLLDSECIITNPPWDRKILHPMIEHFSDMRPTWLLFDADWASTKQAVPYLEYCHVMVAIGRVKWIEDSPHVGKDNSAWYLFDRKIKSDYVKFYGNVQSAHRV